VKRRSNRGTEWFGLARGWIRVRGLKRPRGHSRYWPQPPSVFSAL